MEKKLGRIFKEMTLKNFQNTMKDNKSQMHKAQINASTFFYRKKNIPHDQVIPLLGIYTCKMKTYVCTTTCM